MDDSNNDSSNKDSNVGQTASKDADGPRKTRQEPGRTEVDRSFGNLYGTGASQAPQVESTIDEAFRTMESLLDDESDTYQDGPSGDFGHPFADQSGKPDISQRLGELWIEQVKVWQEFLQELAGGFSLPNAGGPGAPAFDYTQLFKPDPVGFQHPGASPESATPTTVIIANREKVTAEVNWKLGTPSVKVRAQGPFPVEGNEVAKAVQVQFRLSVDGASQVMMIDLTDEAVPGSYTGVICDSTGEDHGYFRVMVPG